MPTTLNQVADGVEVDSTELAAALVADLILPENFPGPGDPEVLAWLEGLGLDPDNIPRAAIVIERSEPRLYWREFALDSEGLRCLNAAESGYVRTGTKSMRLDSIPDFLN